MRKSNGIQFILVLAIGLLMTSCTMPPPKGHFRSSPPVEVRPKHTITTATLVAEKANPESYLQLSLANRYPLGNMFDFGLQVNLDKDYYAYYGTDLRFTPSLGGVNFYLSSGFGRTHMYDVSPVESRIDNYQNSRRICFNTATYVRHENAFFGVEESKIRYVDEPKLKQYEYEFYSGTVGFIHHGQVAVIPEFTITFGDNTEESIGFSLTILSELKLRD